MHSLPLNSLLLALVTLVLLNRKGTRDFLRDFLTVGEDLWTWTTRTGEWYEDVELEKIEDGEVLIKHRFGTCRLAIDRLSEKSHQLLFRTQKWQDHVSAGPVEGKLSPFISPAYAKAA